MGLSSLSRHDWLSVLLHLPCLPRLQVLWSLSFRCTWSVSHDSTSITFSQPPQICPSPCQSLCAPAHVCTSVCPEYDPLFPESGLPSSQAPGHHLSPGRESAARFPSFNLGTLPSSTFSTLNPSQQSPGSSQAPGNGGDGAQWGTPAAAATPPREQMRPIGARRRDFRCPAEGGGS